MKKEEEIATRLHEVLTAVQAPPQPTEQAIEKIAESLRSGVSLSPSESLRLLPEGSQDPSKAADLARKAFFLPTLSTIIPPQDVRHYPIQDPNDKKYPEGLREREKVRKGKKS